MLFYGGIAGGVLLISLSDERLERQPALVPVRLAHHRLPRRHRGRSRCWPPWSSSITLGLRRQLFAVCQDEEFARVAGPAGALLNLLLAVTAAVTVTVAMRVVGLLLVSALMVVPVATAQQLTRGFRTTLALALALGVAVSLAGMVALVLRSTSPPGADDRGAGHRRVPAVQPRCQPAGRLRHGHPGPAAGMAGWAWRSRHWGPPNRHDRLKPTSR